jgi:GTP-binding protein LepA
LVSIITAPTVSYRCKLRDKEELKIVDNPIEAPPNENIEYWEEAIVSATIMTPFDYSISIKKLCEEKRGIMMS